MHYNFISNYSTLPYFVTIIFILLLKIVYYTLHKVSLVGMLKML